MPVPASSALSLQVNDTVPRLSHDAEDKTQVLTSTQQAICQMSCLYGPQFKNLTINLMFYLHVLMVVTYVNVLYIYYTFIKFLFLIFQYL